MSEYIVWLLKISPAKIVSRNEMSFGRDNSVEKQLRYRIVGFRRPNLAENVPQMAFFGLKMH